MVEQFSRIKKVIGINNFNRIKNTSVMIVGIGGVGGSCLEVLARSGIGKIIIIDYDKFEESNLNRQILSLRDNIGDYKVDVAKNRIKLINPLCDIITYKEKVDENFLKNFNDSPDYIIDACDDINAKVLLVKYAIKNNIKIISCCGTGNRINPSKLVITDVWKTKDDPLARKFRYELRKNNIKYNLKVVSSLEKPLIKSKDFVGSMSCVPNAAGILLASYVINDIVNLK